MKLLESLPPDVFTRDQEFDLARKIQHAPNDDDINSLVLHTMRDAFLYSKRVCRNKIADDELFSLCYLALRRSAKRFRPGTLRFMAFSKIAIRGEISDYWKTIDVVKHSSLHEEETTKYLHNGWAAVFLPAGASTGDGEFDDADYEDWNFKPAFDQLIEPHEEADFRSIDFRERLRIVEDIIKKKLTEQEQMVIDLVYRGHLNFQQIGDLTATTRSAAQSTHAKALRKIRNELMRSKKLE